MRCASGGDGVGRGSVLTGLRQTRGRVRALLATGTVASLGAVVGLGVLGAGASSAAGPVAGAARTVNLRDSGRLHLTSHSGLTLNLQGSASGNIEGTIYIHLDVASSTHVTAQVNIYPSGGSLSGNVSAAYEVGGSYASFTGTMKITRGTGTYAHAHASDLRFTGSIKRVNDATTVEVSGPLSY
jgi:hypothetical protein